MDSIFRGDLVSRAGRTRAWVDCLFVDHGVLRLGWRNHGTVAAGKLYRSNQPTPGGLARDARRWGLRTIVNLRGATRNGADALEREAAQRLGLAFVDIALRSRAAPPRESLLRLAEIFATIALPALVHCKSGADRAGFAAGFFLLLQGASSEVALRQLSLRHGHLRHSRAGVLRGVFLQYARDAEGRIPFGEWLREGYDPAALARDFGAGGLSTWLHTAVLRRE